MKLRNKDVNDIALALRLLDNNKEHDYKFKGTTRTAIARKLRIASEIAQKLENDRLDMLKGYDLGNTRVDSKGDTVSADSPKVVSEFTVAYNKMMDTEIEIEIGKFLEADLDFETNHVPGSVIAALLPIITFKAE